MSREAALLLHIYFFLWQVSGFMKVSTWVCMPALLCSWVLPSLAHVLSESISSTATASVRATASKSPHSTHKTAYGGPSDWMKIGWIGSQTVGTDPAELEDYFLMHQLTLLLPVSSIKLQGGCNFHWMREEFTANIVCWMILSNIRVSRRMTCKQL